MRLKYVTKAFARENGWDYFQMNQALIDKHLEDAEITLEVKGDIADANEWEDLSESLLERVTSLKLIDAKRIDEETFKVLSNVRSMWVPRDLKGEDIVEGLAYAQNMEVIQVDSRNPMYCSDEGVLLSKDRKRLIKYPANRKRIVFKVPASVTRIESGAFLEVFYIHTLVIDQPIYLDAFAIRGCPNLKYLLLKDHGNDSIFAPYCIDGERLELIANIDSAAAAYCRSYGVAFVGLE